jgi:hypothetical protein
VEELQGGRGIFIYIYIYIYIYGVYLLKFLNQA